MAQRKKRKATRKKRTKSTGRRFFSYRLLLLLAALLGTAAALMVVLRMPPAITTGSNSPAPSVEKKSSPPTVQSSTAKKRTRQFEEQRLAALEQKTREIDLALLQALVTTGAGSKAIVRQDVELRRHNGSQYPFQNIILNIPGDGTAFISQLRTELKSWVDAASLDQTDGTGRVWLISAQGVATHRILFNGQTAKDHVPPPQHASAALCIVIDDLGENLNSARQLSGLGIPITFSVLPASTRTNETVALARSRGHELLLHLPMQPVGNEYSPGPGALYVDMGADTIRKILRRNLAQVPGAIGVNNHMGSLFTADAKGMGVVMQELKRHNLFFLDSLTTPESTARQQARIHGTAYLQRHIFLDNEQDVEAIIFQLKKAESLALREGYAIAIGHPYEATLEALARWAVERDRRVRLLSLAELNGLSSPRQALRRP